MNVENIKLLAETIRPGFAVFGHVKVGLSLLEHFKKLDHRWERRLDRVDLPDDCTHLGCLVAFSNMLAKDDPSSLLIEDQRQHIIDDIDAAHFLGVNEDQAMDLFYGNISHRVTGEVMYRVLHKFTMTGEIDWMIVERELN